jgi:hypothetical protein
VKAADNVSALLQKMSTQLKLNQLQIEALRRQIDALQNRIDQTPVLPPFPSIANELVSTAVSSRSGRPPAFLERRLPSVDLYFP